MGARIDVETMTLLGIESRFLARQTVIPHPNNALSFNTIVLNIRQS
jgi:hypothetical protein